MTEFQAPDTINKITPISGPWFFQLDQDNIGEEQAWFRPEAPRHAWPEVVVPGAWNLMDTALWSYEGIAWYATVIDPSRVDKERWQRLIFEAVNHHAKVWLNGQYLGEHFGGHLPFEFAVTPSLHSDAPNVLIVRVDNAPKATWLPGNDVIEWVQYGGILQPVSLVTTATVYLNEVAITAEPAPPGARITCRVEVTNTRTTPFSGKVRVHTTIEDNTTESVGDVCCAAGEATTVTLECAAPAAEYWSPETPVLYTLQAEVSDESGCLHSVEERFGIRSIEVRGREILLNGQPLYIRGFNRYDEYAGYGWTVPEALVRADLLRIKQTGANLIRTHYPQSPLHHRIMDEIGLLLMQEVPLNWWKAIPDDPSNDAIIEQASRTLAAMIRCDRNHPCVLIWSMSNECLTHTTVGTAAMRRLLREAKQLDPTRIVTFVVNSGGEENPAYEDADIVAYNRYPGLFVLERMAKTIADIDGIVRHPMEATLRQDITVYPDKPLIIAEFGTHGIPGMHGDTRLSETYQAAYIRAVWEAIQAVPEVSGGILWCWADYYHRVNLIGDAASYTASYGPYGVVTVDRREKEALGEITRMYGGGE
ncbi:MAG: glycoside hydrolase family 2 protein [Armatimonadota bacterium]